MTSAPFTASAIHTRYRDGSLGSPFSSHRCDGTGAPKGQQLGWGEPQGGTSWGCPLAQSRGLRQPRPEAEVLGEGGRGGGSRGQGQADPRVCSRAHPGARARYLHDRLGKVPGAPVTEARLRRGRDEASVSSSVICVVCGLQETERIVSHVPHMPLCMLGRIRRETDGSGVAAEPPCWPHSALWWWGP